ncbi:MAG: hypothetical protein M3Q65_01710 [Chloroflexota bacterium]|nr:hypothetical protein [Chloroflexota bacterium]
MPTGGTVRTVRTRRKGWTALVWWGGLVSVAVLFLALLAPLLGSAAPWEPPSAVYFPQTGHHLEDGFLRFWRSNGRITLLGNPVSEQVRDGDRTVQYFERARLDLGPGADGNRVITIGQLGREMVEARALNRPQPRRALRFSNEPGAEPPGPGPFTPRAADGLPSDSEEVRFFPESGHSLAYSFKLFWERYGDLDRFGLPISEEFREISPADGQIYTTQYPDC